MLVRRGLQDGQSILPPSIRYGTHSSTPHLGPGFRLLPLCDGPANVTLSLIGLPQEVAHLTFGALVIFLPWPGAIGYRRFFHGLLIRNNQTRRVAYGTVVRMTTMSAVALFLYFGFDYVELHLYHFGEKGKPGKVEQIGFFARDYNKEIYVHEPVFSEQGSKALMTTGASLERGETSPGYGIGIVLFDYQKYRADNPH